VTAPPAQPRVYHITHIDNLPSIVADRAILSDSTMAARGGRATVVGMPKLKERCFHLPVGCHPGTVVADYARFYFCPRSIMLYVVYRANHEELAYRGGQDPIVHLEFDCHEVVEWAENNGRRWAFTVSNATARYAPFCARLEDLGQVNWPAVAATEWADPVVKEGKQDEFLVEESLPWELVSRVGVRSEAIAARARTAIARAGHRPEVAVLPDWYY